MVKPKEKNVSSIVSIPYSWELLKFALSNENKISLANNKHFVYQAPTFFDKR